MSLSETRNLVSANIKNKALRSPTSQYFKGEAEASVSEKTNPEMSRPLFKDIKSSRGISSRGIASTKMMLLKRGRSS